MADVPVKGPLAFTASNGTTLEAYDSDFTEIVGGAGYLGITANALTMLFGDPGVDHIYRDSVNSYTADQYSSAALGSFGSTSAHALFLCRASADTGAGRDYYVLRLADGSGGAQTTSVERWNNGTLTTLDTRTSVAWATSDVPKLRAVTNGANCDLVVVKNGAVLYTISDSSPLSGGKPTWGLRMSSANATSLDDGELGDVTAPAGPVITGSITADDAAPTGSIAPTPPSGLSGNLTADDAVASGALSPVVSSVTTLPASRNPGNGARLVSIANVALAVLSDDANLNRLAGSAALNMGSDGRLAFANGVPVPAGTSVVVVTRLPGANGALGVERYITA